VFRDAREYFLDEFGAEPGERMQEAHRRILRAEPVPPPDPVAAAPRLQPAFFQSAARRAPVIEVLFAAIAPLATCGFGAGSYFLYAAIRRHDTKQYIVAAVYYVLFFTGLVALAVDPSPTSSQDLSSYETFGIFLLLPLSLAAALHGVMLALRSGDYDRSAALREQARQFAAFDPARAAEIGIGRPDLPGRLFDDGGLVDLNRIGAYELAQATRMPTEVAQRIVADRVVRGPFQYPAELVERGLADPRTMRKLGYRLICIPPAPTLKD
jgi:hypothetical protein